MALKDGDVIRFDYTLWVEGDKKPLDTSIVDVAKEHGIHNDEKNYTPLSVTLGARQIIPGLESHIRSHGKKGNTVTAELAAADAYGPRDAQKIQDIPMAQFKKQKVTPEVGLVLNFQGQRAVITRVAGGRVRVDMNHDLAGKDLRYEYTITDVVEDDNDKLRIVLENMFGTAPEHSMDETGVTVEVPEQMRYDQQAPMAKLHLVTQIKQAVGPDKAVRLVETYPGQSEAVIEEEE